MTVYVLNQVTWTSHRTLYGVFESLEDAQASARQIMRRGGLAVIVHWEDKQGYWLGFTDQGSGLYWRIDEEELQRAPRVSEEIHGD